jgi:hypothetical protein
VDVSNVKLEFIRLDAVYTVKRLIQEQSHGATGINPRRAVLV